MNRAAAACLLIPLAGCGSILDPAPFNPRLPPSPQDGSTPVADVPSTASGGADAATPAKITAVAGDVRTLAARYAASRDRVMREQLYFDIPMLGLGVAAIVNPLFDGAKAATLALSLGAGATAGTKLYFGPQTKVKAYNTAWLSLDCAASAAAAMANEAAADGSTGPALVGQLDADMQAAVPLVGSNAGLLTARDTAVKSRAALQTALGTLDAAPVTLQTFADAVIRNATNSVVSNAQNVDAAVKLVSAAAPAGTTGKAAGASPAAVGDSRPFAPAPRPHVMTAEDIALLTARLQLESAQADALTARIAAVMAALTKCAAT